MSTLKVSMGTGLNEHSHTQHVTHLAEEHTKTPIFTTVQPTHSCQIPYSSRSLAILHALDFSSLLFSFSLVLFLFLSLF